MKNREKGRNRRNADLIGICLGIGVMSCMDFGTLVELVLVTRTGAG